MQRYRAFISSVQSEFSNEREALYQHMKEDPLLSQFFDPIIFERLPATSRRPDDLYLDEVGHSQIYIGIIGKNYGFQDAEGVSPTEREYDHAESLHIERWIFIKASNEAERHEKEQAFKAKVSRHVSWKSFADTGHLLHEVSTCCVRFLQEQGRISHTPFDGNFHPHAGLTDLDEEKIQQFLREAGVRRQFPLKPGTPSEQVLTHLGMFRDGQISHSALLAFGKKPQRFFPSAIVKCAHFHGREVEKPIPDYKTFQGTVFDQVDQSVDFVLSKISMTVGTRDNSIQAPVSYEIPRAALTEAIVNAIAHRDYMSNGSIQVSLFADRLEVVNPGRLPAELSIDQLKTTHSSYPANPLLAECLYLTGYIERFGTGTVDIFRLSKEARLDEPVFTQDGGFKVTLWRPDHLTNHVPGKYRTSSVQGGSENVDNQGDDDQKQDQGSTGQVPGKYRASTTQGKTEANDNQNIKENYLHHPSREIKRLVIVMEGDLKRLEIQEKLQLKHRDSFTENYLKPAIKEGFIEMTIPNKPTSSRQKYSLTEKGKLLQQILYTQDFI